MSRPSIGSIILSGALFPWSVSAGVIDEAQPLSVGLAKILDFLLSIIGVVAIIGLVIAGGLYFFAAGDMRQLALAKKMTLAAVTGIVIALGGYVLIRTIATFIAS
jgi:ABC-type nickel/cobalt efflux system permease component RcnA